jgi:DNA invertase Pin-like site-specific DNA recombinase
VPRGLNQFPMRFNVAVRASGTGSRGGAPTARLPNQNLARASHERVAAELDRIAERLRAEQRQRRAIAGYAKRAGMVIVAEFNDPAVSGADPTQCRPGFAALLDRIEGNGVRTVIVEDASRFARELMTQELGLLALIKRGVRVVTAGGDDLTDTSDPSRVMMRQIAGSFHEYEKARLVAKLRVARGAKRAAAGKCEGRKSYAERNPKLVAAAKALRAARPHASLLKLSAALAEQGFVTPRGLAYSASAVKSMLGE